MEGVDAESPSASARSSKFAPGLHVTSRRGQMTLPNGMHPCSATIRDSALVRPRENPLRFGCFATHNAISSCLVRLVATSSGLVEVRRHEYVAKWIGKRRLNARLHLRSTCTAIPCTSTCNPATVHSPRASPLYSACSPSHLRLSYARSSASRDTQQRN